MTVAQWAAWAIVAARVFIPDLTNLITAWRGKGGSK